MRDELGEFIRQWNLLPNEADLPLQTYDNFDVNMFTKFISELDTVLWNLRSSGEMANIWEVAGLKRNEVKIAGVFNWFLDGNAEHGQGHRLCCAILECLNSKIIHQGDVGWFQDFPRAECLLDHQEKPSYRAITEVCPMGEQANRVDIEINGERILL